MFLDNDSDDDSRCEDRKSRLRLRERRAEDAAERRAAVKIQSVARGALARKRALEFQSSALNTKLCDLRALKRALGDSFSTLPSAYALELLRRLLMCRLLMRDVSKSALSVENLSTLADLIDPRDLIVKDLPGMFRCRVLVNALIDELSSVRSVRPPLFLVEQLLQPLETVPNVRLPPVRMNASLAFDLAGDRMTPKLLSKTFARFPADTVHETCERAGSLPRVSNVLFDASTEIGSKVLGVFRHMGTAKRGLACTQLEAFLAVRGGDAPEVVDLYARVHGSLMDSSKTMSVWAKSGELKVFDAEESQIARHLSKLRLGSSRSSVLDSTQDEEILRIVAAERETSLLPPDDARSAAPWQSIKDFLVSSSSWMRRVANVRSIKRSNAYVKLPTVDDDENASSDVQLLAIVLSKFKRTSVVMTSLINRLAYGSLNSPLRLLISDLKKNESLFVFCVLCSHMLMMADDFELYGGELLTLTEWKSFVERGVSTSWELENAENDDDRRDKAHAGEWYLSSSEFLKSLRTELNRCLNRLWLRHARCPLLPRETWTFSKPLIDLKFATPFKQRVLNLNALLEAERQAQAEGGSLKLTVRRTKAFEDSFFKLKTVPNWPSKKLFVVFTNEFGLDETGIDAGGLFKELLTCVAKLAFDPNFGLFKSSQTSTLHPSEDAKTVHGVSRSLEMFEFVGAVVGKAVLENVTLQVVFSHFFLTKILKRYPEFDALKSLDEELYKNLLFVKSVKDEETMKALDLTFSASSSVNLTKVSEVDLCPNGSSKSVTLRDKNVYVRLMAHFKLNACVAEETKAFTRGFYSVISPSWLEGFVEPELSVLLSGPGSCAIDVTEWRSHTSYAAGYFSLHPTVKAFWRVLNKFSNADLRALLKFVTSCERLPLLGFESLVPQFTVVRTSDTSKLPFSSTCFNRLYLPPYSSEREVAKKLKISIHSNSGFERS